MSIPFRNEFFDPGLKPNSHPAPAEYVEWPSDNHTRGQKRDGESAAILPTQEVLAKRTAHLIQMARQTFNVLYRAGTLPTDVLEKIDDGIDHLFTPVLTPNTSVLNTPKSARENGIGLLVMKDREEYVYGKSFSTPIQDQRKAIRQTMGLLYPSDDTAAIVDGDRSILDNTKYDPAQHPVSRIRDGASAKTDVRHLLFKRVNSRSLLEKDPTKARHKNALQKPPDHNLRAWATRPLITMKMVDGGVAYPLQLFHQMAHAQQIIDDSYTDIENRINDVAGARYEKLSPEERAIIRGNDHDAKQLLFTRMATEHPGFKTPEENGALTAQRTIEQGLLLANFNRYAPRLTIARRAFQCVYYDYSSEVKNAADFRYE